MFNFHDELVRISTSEAEARYDARLSNEKCKALEEVVARLSEDIRMLGGNVEYYFVKHILSNPIRRPFSADLHEFHMVEPFTENFIRSNHEILHKLEVIKDC